MLKEIKIFDTVIAPGKSYKLNFNMAKLYTSTSVEVPVIIERSKKAGPVVLLTGGIHGDEINGTEVVRQIISKKLNKPAVGMIIAIPVLNIFGFLNNQREFPDGRDLNRVFPGTKSGALASRFAYHITKELLPHVDLIMDFHTGGAQRFNAPHLRVSQLEVKSWEYAQIFNAPFLMHARNIKKTFRATCSDLGKPYLLFEGGMSSHNDKEVATEAVNGVLRVLDHLHMLKPDVQIPEVKAPSIVITDSKWLRAKYSGLLHPKVECGKYVTKDEYIATITDPYGELRYKVKAPHAGYVINVNLSPLVYQGDAIFHISKHQDDKSRDQEEV
ncbi:succinylglutamate desuccinylase/aspartoacylase family protein [Nonlabens xiamenensis]|uniref:succinylglutamate desuccinylase/aspartoacylase family protein n=1 Tax=Nonlabens xiamenensis TaxID=2341043 RepID=UPI001F0BFDB9|nr:succinylglutamate desuccinylase/aspartoacylase family protein [Nonlabens xiamenensis]